MTKWKVEMPASRYDMDRPMNCHRTRWRAIEKAARKLPKLFLTRDLLEVVRCRTLQQQRTSERRGYVVVTVQFPPPFGSCPVTFRGKSEYVDRAIWRCHKSLEKLRGAALAARLADDCDGFKEGA